MGVLGLGLGLARFTHFTRTPQHFTHSLCILSPIVRGINTKKAFLLVETGQGQVISAVKILCAAQKWGEGLATGGSNVKLNLTAHAQNV